MSQSSAEIGDRDYRISAVEKAFAVFDAFSVAPHRFTLSEISTRTGLSTNQTFRLLHTLTAIGYVRQEPETKIYSLGPRSFGIVPALFNSDELLLAARDALNTAYAQTGEVVSLIVLDSDGGTVCIAVRDGSDPSLIPSAIGSRVRELHAGAVGKLFLANQPDDAIERYLASGAPLRRFTAHTIVAPDQIWEQIRAIRADGHSISNEEVAKDMYGVASAVRDRRGQVIAAVTLAAPLSRSQPKERERHLAVVKDTARRISTNLGYRAVMALG